MIVTYVTFFFVNAICNIVIDRGHIFIRENRQAKWRHYLLNTTGKSGASYTFIYQKHTKVSSV